jgi:hypothetical protein
LQQPGAPKQGAIVTSAGPVIGQSPIDPCPIDFLWDRSAFQVEVAVFEPVADWNSESLFRPVNESVRD